MLGKVIVGKGTDGNGRGTYGDIGKVKAGKIGVVLKGIDPRGTVIVGIGIAVRGNALEGVVGAEAVGASCCAGRATVRSGAGATDEYYTISIKQRFKPYRKAKWRYHMGQSSKPSLGGRNDSIYINRENASLHLTIFFFGN